MKYIFKKKMESEKKNEEKEFEIIKNDIYAKLAFKIIVIGDTGVGKTSLSEKGTKGIFSDSTTPTIGFDYYKFIVKYKNEIIKLEIWDTCGQEAYRSLITNYYKNSYLAIIVYAINKYIKKIILLFFFIVFIVKNHLKLFLNGLDNVEKIQNLILN